MSDETNNPWTSTPVDTPTNQEPAATDRVGFCQNCGRPLTTATVRNVGTGVFCEPCLTARAGVPNPTPGYASVPPYTPVPPYTTISPQAAVATPPSPALAFVLGLFPGVGAMYNGQFAKGIAHLIVFVILVSFARNISDVFGFLIAGWIVFMAFDAYHTAKARLEGLPLPNAFGFNDIGERMGFGKSWGTVAPVTPVGTPQTPPPPPTTAPGYVPVTQASASTAPDWVGYVAPTAFGTAAAQQAAAAAQLREQALRDSGYYNHAPYAPTYTGPDTQANPYAIPFVPVDAPVPQRRFPVGAFWLIALGVIILLANIIPDWEMSSRWWPPILFAGLAGWIFTRRLRSGAKLICIIRWPLVLMVLAIMLALHAANVAVTFGLTCAVLLILFGGLLLLERTVGASPSYAAPVPTTGYTSVIPPSEPVDPQPRATWSETDTPKEDHIA